MGAKAIILNHSVLTVSSTYVRDNIDNGTALENLIDSRVFNYIKEIIYTGCDFMNSDEYKKLIKSRMSDYRYTHSVNVSKEAVRLAKNTVQILKSSRCRHTARHYQRNT